MTLLRSDMADDPIQQFQIWLEEARQTDIEMPEAMTLATSNRRGQPAARIVLLRGVDEHGFVFFTNYQSRKAQDLDENPQAALTFYWPPLARQVRIEGAVERVSATASDNYFATRPRGSQLGAHASPQSQVIEDRNFLASQVENIEEKFADKEVQRPAHWGGYRVIPEVLEFWQSGDNRLHDRLRYRRAATGNWLIERLAP